MVVLSIHIQAMNDLKERLTGIGVSYTERRFRSDDGLEGITTEFLVSSHTCLCVWYLY